MNVSQISGSKLVGRTDTAPSLGQCLESHSRVEEPVQSSLGWNKAVCKTSFFLPSEYNQLCPVSMVIWKMFYFKHLLQNHTISKATPSDKTHDTTQIKHVDTPCQAYKRGSAQKKHSSFSFFFW